MLRAQQDCARYKRITPIHPPHRQREKPQRQRHRPPEPAILSQGADIDQDHAQAIEPVQQETEQQRDVDPLPEHRTRNAAGSPTS
jgi:hypothetical protein